ncbi:MAG: alanine--glyoxylate aminotransferase family protein [Candidatus Sumerlaeaceae bacterium]|nr:alanine--glyoxylate aminotransferase family protein [Candidatus Sumerlaeaceae bacterium]
MKGSTLLRKNYIYAPGPVSVPPQVLAATAKPIIHHRSADFDPLFKKVSEGLKYIFQTKNPVVTFASSGTGAMEAAIVSTASPGDHVISLESGKFGERWGELSQAYGFDVDRVQFEWGYGPDPNKVAELLKARPDTKAVYIELCETSTGTVSDVKAVAEITRNTDTLLIVDAVSGLCADELRSDEWGVDLVGTGSQKGVMLPPGLGFVSVSAKAQEAIKKSKCPKFYFSLAKALKELEKNTTPFTPAVNLIFGLEVALDMIQAEGIENVWARHARLAEGSRQAMKAINCTLFSKAPANTVTTVNVPDDVDGSKIVKTLKEMGVIIAGGQGHLKGKIFRFATLGYYNEFDVITIVDAVEQALAKLGHKFDRGAGVNAAQKYFAG